MRRLLFILPLLIFVNTLRAQNVKIVFKLKKDAPQSVFNDVKSNVASVNSPVRLLNKYNGSRAEQVFSTYIKRLSVKDNSDFGLDRIFVSQSQEQPANELIRELAANKYVEYAEKINLCKLESAAFTPNDTYFPNQYYLSAAGMLPLYGIADATGVVVGVIDSGLDFLHPDMLQSFYVNPGESGNGKETNGIDDDGNGFIDDWRGWNFIGNDNNPSDDNLVSHGTSVASVISAGYNNAAGITPAAPFSKCLVMKCFNAQGQGYEDNIASAILYGVMQGAMVLNFSFGDYIHSNLLKDVIAFAYAKNVTMVSSAGNDNSDALHYPSSFDEVISAGATDDFDRKATFSAYGQTVDVFAPGVNILTASRTGLGSAEFGGNYQYSNGTSFSAPIVSAMSAVLKAKNPNLTNEEIRGIFVSSTRYFTGQSGWDYVYSSGILNCETSFANSSNPSAARIFSPYLNFAVTKDTVPLFITAASAFFRSYSVSYGIGMNPSAMNIIFSSTSQTVRDTIAFWKTNGIPDTTLTLILAINTNNGRTIEHRTVINKGNAAPMLEAYDSKQIIFKGSFAERIRFVSDAPTIGIVHYRKKNTGEPYGIIYADEGNLGFFKQEHSAYLKHTVLQTGAQYEYYIEIISRNGKSVTQSNPGFEFTAKGQIEPYGFIKKTYSLPQSQVCNTVVSLSGNGVKTLFTNSIKNGLIAEAYNFTSNAFTKISPSPWIGNSVSRDAADIDSDGKFDLLTSVQRNGALYEAPVQGQLPSLKIWENGSSDDFWSSKFADVDGDGANEILGFGKQGLIIMKTANGISQFAMLPYYPAANSPYSNSQSALTGDYNSNGKTEIVFTNNYADNSGGQNSVLNIYEHGTGSNYARVFSSDLPSLVMKGDNLTDGDFDGDGKKEFAAGFSSDSKTGLNLFVLFIYKYANNQYTETALEFYNNYSGDGFCKAGDIDNDGRDEILVNFDRNFYAMKFDGASYKPVYYSGEYSSYNSVVFDFDNNGIKEIGINNKDSLVFIEKDAQFSGPATPVNISGYSLDSNRAVLNFSPVESANYYKVYRADSDSTGYSLYDSTAANTYTDVNVTNRRDYYYKLSSVSISNPVKESRLSESVRIYVHNKSRLTGAVFADGLLSLTFSKKISLAIPEISVFKVNGNIIPTTAGVKNPYAYVLSFSPLLENGVYSIRTKGLKDFYNSPVDTNELSFSVSRIDSVSFYITSVSLIQPSTLKAEFNLNTDTVTSLNASNYSFEPFGINAVSVRRDDSKKSILYLQLSGTNVGASGRTYFLRVSGIYSENGIKITKGSGSVFSLTFVKEDLSGVVVYPNPYNHSKSVNKKITFANLTKTAVVRVYTITGEFIKELKTTGENGGIEWDAKDSRGGELPSGVYIFKAEGKNSAGQNVEEKTGKFAVIK